METIQLKRKKVINLNLEVENKNGEFEVVECVACIDAYTIEQFQKDNNKGFLKSLNQLDGKTVRAKDIQAIKQLLGSIIRIKKTNRMLGANYFNQFDDIDILNSPLINMLIELTNSNLPKGNGESEKK